MIEGYEASGLDLSDEIEPLLLVLQHRLSVHALEDGKKLRDIALDIGSVDAFSGRKEDTMVSADCLVYVHAMRVHGMSDAGGDVNRSARWYNLSLR